MFQRQRGNDAALGAAPADTAEADNSADINSTVRECTDLAGGVEIVLLQANGDRNGHRRCMRQPPVIGGKNAISPAPTMDASSFTWI